MQTNSRGMGRKRGGPCLPSKQTMGKKPNVRLEKPKQTNRYSDRTIRDHFGMGLAISMESEDKDTESTYIKRL